jgi:hypothetical protein
LNERSGWRQTDGEMDEEKAMERCRWREVDGERLKEISGWRQTMERNG